jgi:hypothetical protein
VHFLLGVFLSDGGLLLLFMHTPFGSKCLTSESVQSFHMNSHGSTHGKLTANISLPMLVGTGDTKGDFFPALENGRLRL